MARKMIDCRDYPSVNNCTISIAADTEEELLDLAALHAVDSHEHVDSPELRAELRKAIKETALT